VQKKKKRVEAEVVEVAGAVEGVVELVQREEPE